jgi:anthranilate synthase component 2
MHGKQSEVALDNACPIFQSMPRRIKAARYHSLAAVRDTLPACLRITAETDDGEIMGVMHEAYPVYGVQFHPESILTPDGMQIIRNFLAL